MDVFYVYTYGTAAWLGMQALPLIATPKLIVAMLAVETRSPTCTDTLERFLLPGLPMLTFIIALEEYFCRCQGLVYITLGILTVLLTGSVPLTSTFSESMFSSDICPNTSSH